MEKVKIRLNGVHYAKKAKLYYKKLGPGEFTEEKLKKFIGDEVTFYEDMQGLARYGFLAGAKPGMIKIELNPIGRLNNIDEVIKTIEKVSKQSIKRLKDIKKYISLETGHR